MMYAETDRWICFAVGFVFLTSGIIKLVVSDFKIIFANLGLPFPEFTLFLIALMEIACGMLVAARMFLKQSVPPLVLIMLGALFLTKLPILSNGGFLTFVFEARLDIVMLILLMIIWRNRRAMPN